MSGLVDGHFGASFHDRKLSVDSLRIRFSVRNSEGPSYFPFAVLQIGLYDPQYGRVTRLVIDTKPPITGDWWLVAGVSKLARLEHPKEKAYFFHTPLFDHSIW